MVSKVDGRHVWPRLSTIEQAIEAYHEPVYKKAWSLGVRKNERHLNALLYIKGCIESGQDPIPLKCWAIATGKLKD